MSKCSCLVKVQKECTILRPALLLIFNTASRYMITHPCLLQQNYYLYCPSPHCHAPAIAPADPSCSQDGSHFSVKAGHAQSWNKTMSTIKLKCGKQQNLSPYYCAYPLLCDLPVISAVAAAYASAVRLLHFGCWYRARMSGMPAQQCEGASPLLIWCMENSYDSRCHINLLANLSGLQ